jgi:hypothetical protein
MRRVVSTMAVAIAFSLSALPLAPAQTMKEGKSTGMYVGWGTAKVTAVGKERTLITFEDFGPVIGGGIFEHTAWRCWGIGDFVNGKGRSHGHCLGQDPTGDQVVHDWTDTEDHTLDAKTVRGALKLTSGTGKFAGITGSGTYEDHGNEWKPITEGTYMVDVSFEISYKLPEVSQ